MTKYLSIDDLKDTRNTVSLPNLDFSIFEEITGISKEHFELKLGETLS